ncbi:MAG: hypothetical protein K8R49_00410 [Candidatus Cloacimonetes bacterium]|nr:hypothetical protein [Candidatus Cloacimonadota bacterium]
MKKYLIIVGVLLCTALFSNVMLYHNPPVSIKPGETVVLTLEVRDGFNEIFNAKLFYRETGTLSFTELDLEKGTETDPVFFAVVEDVSNYQVGLNYYFLIIPYDGNNVTLPEFQCKTNPFKVAIEQPKVTTESFVRLSPDIAFSDIGKDYIIAISMFSIESDIDHSSVKFYYDLEDVTDAAKIFSNMIIYEVEKTEPGRHFYYVAADLTDGRKVESEHWMTDVKIKTIDLPMNIRGKATFNSYLSSFNKDSEDEAENDKRANFLLNFQGNKDWFRFKSKMYLSSLETSSAQAINRFNLALQVPHFDLVAGDHTSDYGSFILNCKNVWGIHTKLHFENFRLFVTYGNSKRNIDGKAYSDTTDITSYTAGTFRRKTMVFRTEVGNTKSFVWGLGISKNKDDIGSLHKKYYQYVVDDTIVTMTVTPKDNIIFGSDIRLALFKQRFVCGAEAAMSFHNNDITEGTMSLDEIEDNLGHEVDLPFDPETISDFIIVNEYMEPFMPGFSNSAFKTFIRSFFYNNLLNISYTAIGSSFNSLSSSYLQKDARIINVNDNINLLNNKLSMNLSFNIISDNLYEEKDVTTKTTTYFAQVLFRPTDQIFYKIGFNNNTSKDNMEITEDDTLETTYDINSMNLTLGFGYHAQNFSFAPTRFILNFCNSANTDEANKSFDYKKNNIILSAKSKFEEIPLKTTLSYSLNLNDDKTSTYNDTLSEWVDPIQEKSKYHSFYMKGEFLLLEEKFKPYLDFRYTAFGGDINSQASQMFNLGTSYNIDKDTFLSTVFGLKLYQNKDYEEDNYSSFNWKFRLTRKF